MANTVIRIRSSGVFGNTPTTLQPGELAINYADGKLYYGDANTTVTLFDAITEPAGLNGEIQFNNFGSFGSDEGLVYNTANNTLILTNLVVGTTNVVSTINYTLNFANSAHNQANAAYTLAQAAFDSGNTFSSSISTALNQANTAVLTAQAAFEQANTAIDNAVAMAIALG